MENNENQNLQNRREFFKEAAQKALPILGLVLAASTPGLLQSCKKDNTTGCKSSCTGTCLNGCSDGCTNRCSGTCSGTCKNTCKNGCRTGCNTTCVGGCKRYSK